MVLGNHLKRILSSAFSPRHLMVTNTTLGVGAWVGADVVQQLASHYVYPKKDDVINKESDVYKHDARRTMSMAAGGLCFAPVGHYWYQFLDKRFPGNTIKILSKKLLIEAIIAPPLVTLCYLIVAKTEGKTIQEGFKSFKEIFIYIILSDWLCFVPLQALNFFFLPPKYRYLCVACLTFFYDNFLSFIFHK